MTVGTKINLEKELIEVEIFEETKVE